MAKRVCGESGCPALVDQGARGGRCADHERARDKTRGTRQERGYDKVHQRTRDELLPLAYGQPCLYCGQRMWPHQHLDLDHNEDRDGYRGIVHADYRNCPAGGNRAAGGRASHRG